MAISSYRDLDVWQVSMAFVEQVYLLTSGFPRAEAYGLTNQLRRAAVGIPSNISEGHQQSTRAYRHARAAFCTVSSGAFRVFSISRFTAGNPASLGCTL
jgi:four helix bundle protein